MEHSSSTAPLWATLLSPSRRQVVNPRHMAGYIARISATTESNGNETTHTPCCKIIRGWAYIIHRVRVIPHDSQLNKTQRQWAYFRNPHSVYSTAMSPPRQTSLAHIEMSGIAPGRVIQLYVTTQRLTELGEQIKTSFARDSINQVKLLIN